MYEVLHKAIELNIAVPLATLARLRPNDWRGSFLWMPESRVIEPNGDVFCEIDIWAVANGSLIIGEATRGVELADTKRKENIRISRLVEIADGMTVDSIAIASTGRWNKRTVEALRRSAQGKHFEVQVFERLRVP